MADISGKGGATQRNILGTAMKMQGKNGKPDYYIVDAQIDMRDNRKDPNPHLESHEFEGKDGQKKTAHGRFYTAEQWASMEAAFETREGKDGKIEFAGKANLMSKTDKSGHKSVIIRTDQPMGKSDNKFGPKALQTQAKYKKEAKAAYAEARAASKDAPAVEMEAPTAEAQYEGAEPM